MSRSNTQTRLASFEVMERGVDGRIPVVVSTDAVVVVADGPEILDHSASAVDMSRAPLPIIVTHKDNQINVGIVEDIILSDGKMRGYARFGVRPEAIAYKADVEAKIIRSISVGYSRKKAIIRKDGVMVTTRWMPTHAALVAEPADIGAGFFRESGADSPCEFTNEENATIQHPEVSVEALPVQITRSTQPQAAPAITKRGHTMSDANNAQAGATADNSNADHSARNSDGSLMLEELRVAGIRNIAKEHRVGDDVIKQWISEGYSVDDAARCTLDLLTVRAGAAKQVNPSEIGLSKKEAAEYSTFKAIRAILNNNWSKAGLEYEAHEAIQKRLGGNPLNERTFFMPVEAQVARKHREVRDMTSAGASGSNYLVGTENMSFIDLLRNRSVLMQMGATKMGGLIGNVTIPRETAQTTSYWLTNEATAITEGQPTIGQLSLSPKHVGAYTEISRLLALQSSPDAEMLVMNDLAKSVATAADLAGIAGTNSGGQPQGIIGTSGVGAVTGTSLAFAGVLESQTDIGNALSLGCGYVTTPAVAALLMQRVKVASTWSPLWEAGNILDGTLCGFRAMSSAQMSSATMIFGDWSQVVMAEWGSLAIEVNPYANFPAGLVGVRALYAMDIGVRIPGAFSVTATIT